MPVIELESSARYVNDDNIPTSDGNDPSRLLYRKYISVICFDSSHVIPENVQ